MADLMIAGRPACRCACGGLIIADTDRGRDVERAILHHQLTRAHQTWRERLGL